MQKKFNIKPIEHLNDPNKKESLNKKLFKEVAPKYDLINRILSFDRDKYWKKYFINKMLPENKNPVCLDLACGTGDITRLLSARFPDGKIIGLDLTPEMLEIANEIGGNNIEYIEGSMSELPFEDTAVNVVTGSYALRNAPDLGLALSEVARVLNRGGIAAFLDFSNPKNSFGKLIHYWLLKLWGGFWGLIFHGNHNVYGYIADSLRLFPCREDLRNCFKEAGFKEITSKRFFFGIIEAVVVEKV